MYSSLRREELLYFQKEPLKRNQMGDYDDLGDLDDLDDLGDVGE